jgi:hypothetical protein
VLALAKKGIRSMAFAETVRFMKLRMCSPAEEEMLNDADQDKRGLVQVNWPTPAQATASAEPVPIDSDIDIDAASEPSGDSEPGEDSEKSDAPSSSSDFELPSERFARERKEADEDSES